MTVWFKIDGIDLAVTGEHIRGYTPQLDKFAVRRVYVRSSVQDVRKALGEGFVKHLTAKALEMAQHPVPIELAERRTS